MIVSSISSTTVIIRAEADAIEKVIFNLLSNSLKYTQAGGTIALAVDVDDEAQRVRISVTDNGPGISNVEDILEGNFKSRTGLGLGLRGIKRLAKNMDIRTKAGKGTIVVAEVELR